MVEETVAAITAEVPEYERSRDPDLIRELLANVEENARLWYRVVLRGKPATTDETQRVAESARDRVHQGVPLPALLHSFRIGSVVFWRTLLDALRTERPAVQSEALLKTSLATMMHVDLVSQTITKAYMEEAGDRVRWRDRLKQELCDLALRDAPDEQAFEAKAATLGLDPTSTYCALAVDMGRLPGDNVDRGVARTLERLGMSLGMRAEAFIDSSRDGRLLVWAPAPAGDAGRWEREKLLSAAVELVERDDAVAMVGLGSPGRRATGWGVSGRQALRALEVGTQVHPRDHVHVYSGLAVYDVAVRTPEVAAFLRRLLERLSGEEALLDSIDAYLEHGRHTKAAAAALRIHPNTLAYRLRRAEEALGGRLDDPDWGVRIQLAIKLRRFGGDDWVE